MTCATPIAATQTNFSMPACLTDPFVGTFSANFSIANASRYFQAGFSNAAPCGGSALVNSQFSFCECVQRPLRPNTWYRIQAYNRTQFPCGNPFSSPVVCGSAPLPTCCPGTTNRAPPCLAASLAAPLALMLVLLALFL